MKVMSCQSHAMYGHICICKIEGLGNHIDAQTLTEPNPARNTSHTLATHRLDKAQFILREKQLDAQAMQESAVSIVYHLQYPISAQSWPSNTKQAHTPVCTCNQTT